jgi:hypothetical protein
MWRFLDFWCRVQGFGAKATFGAKPPQGYMANHGKDLVNELNSNAPESSVVSL